MAEKLADFLEKKLIVVTGKGGAGKSLLALSLAHRLAVQGKRVWLVEVGRNRDHSFSRLPELVGKKNLGHKPENFTLPHSEVNILISVLDPAKSLAEYVDLKLPTGGLAGLLLGNNVTASFLEVVPGLPDLVVLGKIWHSLAHPGKGENPDVIVLDAPATGHAISFLKAPFNFRRITRNGPVFRDASLMTEFLADSEKTGIALVTLPEEMSIQETVEMKAALAKDFVPPFVFVNKIFPELPDLESKKNSPVWQAYSYSRKRAEREREACSALGRLPKHFIPYFFPEPESGPLYLKISETLL